MMFDLISFLKRQQKFSLKAFGPGPRTKGIIEHIKKELVEVEQDPTDVKEWLDVGMLAFDAALRIGATPEQIVEELVFKLKRNENRKWPDWRTMSEDVAIEHDRTKP